MKNLFTFLYLIGFAFTAGAQDIAADKVPYAVLNAFQGKFPNVQEVQWEMKGEVYKAEFEFASRDHELSIDKAGTIVRHKEDFPKKQLSNAIQQRLSTDFPTYKLDDADKIEMDGKVFYEVDLDGPSDKRELLLTEDGQVQKNKVD
jgi:uncharacterized membrane protein YkoI